MLRKSARVSGRIVVSAVLSWALIPIAVADAPTQSTNPKSAAESAEANFKRLHTVPEDGMGDDHWLSGATNFIRQVLAQRPNEDLVICVAGCIGKQDRVVYAQPAEPTSRQPVGVVSDAMPAPAMDSTAETPAQADAGTSPGEPSPVESSEPAAASTDDADKKPEFVPSMAQPGNAEKSSEGADEAAPEAVEEPAAENGEATAPASDEASEEPR